MEEEPCIADELVLLVPVCDSSFRTKGSGAVLASAEHWQIDSLVGGMKCGKASSLFFLKSETWNAPSRSWLRWAGRSWL